MKRWVHLKIVVSVVIAAALIAGIYVKLIENDNIFGTLTLLLMCMNLLLYGIDYMFHDPQRSFQMKLKRVSFYYVLFLVFFFIVGAMVTEKWEETLIVTLIMLLLGTKYSLNAWENVFKKGWGTFFSVMIVPVLLIVWLSMFGLTIGTELNRWVLYYFLLISGSIYWLLVVAISWSFQDYILNKGEQQTR